MVQEGEVDRGEKAGKRAREGKVIGVGRKRGETGN